MRNQYDEGDVRRFIESLASQIAAEFNPLKPLNVIGIRTRGETLAQRLTDELKNLGFQHIGRGVLDITLYRDDLSEVGPRPMVRPTQINIAIDGIPLLLSLTSPAGRPIQTTADLPGFWRGSWREVVREMKGRYPRHRWPDEPWRETASLKTRNAFQRAEK